MREQAVAPLCRRLYTRETVQTAASRAQSQRTVPGRLLRDIGRKLADLQEQRRAVLKAGSSERCRSVVSDRTKRNKLYALHAPEVECIGKGTTRQPYTFGVKSSFGDHERVRPNRECANVYRSPRMTDTRWRPARAYAHPAKTHGRKLSGVCCVPVPAVRCADGRVASRPSGPGRTSIPRRYNVAGLPVEARSGLVPDDRIRASSRSPEARRVRRPRACDAAHGAVTSARPPH